LSAPAVRAQDAEATPAIPADTLVTVTDAAATHLLLPRPDRVGLMLDQAVMSLVGMTNATQAWSCVAGPGDVVAVKVFSAPGPNSGTRPAVVEATVRGLISAGVPPTNIIIWDRHLVDLRLSGFPALAERTGVLLKGALQSGYNPEDYYEQALIAALRFGDLEFGQTGEGVGRKSHVTRLLGPEVTRIISIAPALNKHSTGVTGHLYSLALGAVDNTWRFEINPSSLRVALPELYAKRSIGDRVALCITDALICQYEGEGTSLLHYSTTANQLMVGADPVALDVLAVRLLQSERQVAGSPDFSPDMAIYRNARLLQLGTDNPDTLRVRRIRTDNPSGPAGVSTNRPAIRGS
jgi:hypothetical protein